jgi:hypothetical protein
LRTDTFAVEEDCIDTLVACLQIVMELDDLAKLFVKIEIVEIVVQDVAACSTEVLVRTRQFNIILLEILLDGTRELESFLALP